MKNETYIPQPVDANDVVLPEELNQLAEQMAKNVHEIWAQTRISQGWTYGPERNDITKKHPCLVQGLRPQYQHRDTEVYRQQWV